LIDAGIAPSTGGVRDSFDNALAENLWSTTKIELIYWPATTFATSTEAQVALFRYIDGWYNAAAASTPTGYPPTRGCRSQVDESPGNPGKFNDPGTDGLNCTTPRPWAWPDMR
jgi:putative transposase